MTKNGKGFTLIEMLISLVIFSLLIAISAYSFRFYINIIKKITQPYPKEALNLTYLEDSLRDVFFYVDEISDAFGKKKFSLYFKGYNNKIYFITDNFLNKNSVFICRLFIDNKKDLILEGSDVYSKVNNYKSPKIVKPEKIVILKNVSSIKAEYLLGGKWHRSLHNKIPQLIKVSVVKEDNTVLNLYAKVKSNFKQKTDFEAFLYVPSI